MNEHREKEIIQQYKNIDKETKDMVELLNNNLAIISHEIFQAIEKEYHITLKNDDNYYNGLYYWTISIENKKNNNDKKKVIETSYYEVIYEIYKWYKQINKQF